MTKHDDNLGKNFNKLDRLLDEAILPAECGDWEGCNQKLHEAYVYAFNTYLECNKRLRILREEFNSAREYAEYYSGVYHNRKKMGLLEYRKEDIEGKIRRSNKRVKDIQEIFFNLTKKRAALVDWMEGYFPGEKQYEGYRKFAERNSLNNDEEFE